MKLDIEAIAREAGISVAHRGDIEYDPYKVSELILQRFAALLLEKVAQEEMAPGIYTKHDMAERIRQMAAGMGE